MWRRFQGSLRSDQSLAGGNSRLAHVIEKRLGLTHLIWGQRDLVFQLKQVRGSWHTVQFGSQSQPPAATPAEVPSHRYLTVI